LEKDLGVKRKHMAGLVNEISVQFSEKDKINERNAKSIAAGTAK